MPARAPCSCRRARKRPVAACRARRSRGRGRRASRSRCSWSTTAPSGLVADALVRDRLARLRSHPRLRRSGSLAVCVSCRERLGRAARGEYYALLLRRSPAWLLRRVEQPDHALPRARAVLDLALHPLRDHDRARESLEAGAQVPHRRQLRLGDPPLREARSSSAPPAPSASPESRAGAREATASCYVAGLAMILVGLGFKVSAAPFHLWTPDVYEGAPTPVTAFMAAATKVAALVAHAALPDAAFPSEAELWTIALAVLVCHLARLGEHRRDRPAEPQAGARLLERLQRGLPTDADRCRQRARRQALLYYLIPYAALSIGAFAVVAARERELGRPVTLENSRGLRLGTAVPRRRAGAPSRSASSACRRWGSSSESSTCSRPSSTWAGCWLMIVGAVFTAVSIYYYRGIVRALYMAAGRPVDRARRGARRRATRA